MTSAQKPSDFPLQAYLVNSNHYSCSLPTVQLLLDDSKNFDKIFIMASTAVINPVDCKVLKCFKVEVSTKRYLLITVKTYPSSESYTSIQLFKLDEETKEYTPQKYLTLKFQELNKIPWDDVYTNVVNNFAFSLDIRVPYHKNDMDYFDFIFDVQDFLSNKSRLVRVASKRYPQASYVYLKLFIQHQKRCKMQQTIDISWMELSHLLKIVNEIQSYTSGIPKEGSPITETGLFRPLATLTNPEISSSSVSSNSH